MRNFPSQEFEKYFFDLIESSFFEQEKKGFFLGLKTLNISKKDLILFIFEELNKQTIQNGGNIEISLKDLPKSTLLNKITTLIETGDLKYLAAADVLSKSLNSIFVMFMQDLKKTNDTLYYASVTTLEKNKELIRGRFNYDETKENNIIFVEEKFKGQHSFILKKAISATATLKIINKLKLNYLVDSVTTTSKFQKIFLGGKILNDEKVDWIGTIYELKIFLQSLKPRLKIDSNIYNTALRCFTIKSKEINEIEQISKSKKSKNTQPKTQIIEDIISLF